MWQYWTLTLMAVMKMSTSQGSVSNIQVQNNVYPEEGKSIVIKCTITGFSTSTKVFVYRGNSTDFRNDFLEYCISNKCTQNGATILGRYTITADSSSVSISIQAVSRSEDQKYWTCEMKTPDSKQQIFLKFPTVPASLNISPNQDLDLSIQSVSFTCGTANCVSPEPTFSWYISDDGQPAQRYIISETKGTTGTKCPDFELMYTSTFTLRQYTTSFDNLDKTVKFQCRIDSFPGVTSSLNSSWSGNVRCAVNVTSVTLTFGGTIPTYTDTITVGSHVQTTLACTPSTSRPPAIVVWYIGNSVIQNGGEVLKYTFNYDENDQQIYCIVSNIPGGQVITSAKPKLYVQVEVSSVLIKDNNKNLDNDTTVMVTSGSSKTLTCVPSLCRPAATVTWYIGGVQKTSSSTSYNFTFMPTDDDHHKQIYCTAINLRTFVTSKKPVLYFRVSLKVLLMNQTRFTATSGAKFMESVPVYSISKDMKVMSIKRLDNKLVNRIQFISTSSNITTDIQSTTVLADVYVILLMVNNVTEEDFGNYLLEISNSNGSLEWNFSLIAQSQDPMSSCTQTKCTQTPAIIGGIVSSIVVCVLTAVISVLIARHYQKTTKFETHTYEGVKPERDVTNLYDSLKREAK